VIRIESPIRGFARHVTADVEIGDALIPAGSRALMLYACANRDPDKFPDPERFTINRRPSDHLGFGMGTHVCAGMHLAKLEISVILETMARKVRRIEAAIRSAARTTRCAASLRSTAL
jgi:cytochrome P450